MRISDWSSDVCSSDLLDVLTFVYPVWFGTPPAMLKGYLERVVGSGIGFGSGVEYPKPLVNVRLVQISTSSSSTPWLNEKGVPSALHTLFDNYKIGRAHV